MSGVSLLSDFSSVKYQLYLYMLQACGEAKEIVFPQTPYVVSFVPPQKNTPTPKYLHRCINTGRQISAVSEQDAVETNIK